MIVSTIAAVPFIVYTIAAFGFAYVAGHSLISVPVRRRIFPEGTSLETRVGKARAFVITLIECPACMGTWIGMLTWLALAWAGLVDWRFFLVAGFYTAGSNYILARFSGLI